MCSAPSFAPARLLRACRPGRAGQGAPWCSSLPPWRRWAEPASTSCMRPPRAPSKACPSVLRANLQGRASAPTWSSPARSRPESIRRGGWSTSRRRCRWDVPAPWRRWRGRWFSCSRSNPRSPRGRCCGSRGDGDQIACVLAATTYDRRRLCLDDATRESFMVAAVRVHKHGGPEVLTYEEIDIAPPGPGQVRLKQHAAGINFIDTYFRMGMYPSPVGLPFVSGNEGAGEVIALGAGVTD